MMPTTGQRVHCPPNQCCTAEYQRSVVGKKKKPRTGHSTELNMPWNQVVKNQRSTMTRRGVMSAKTARRHGMGPTSDPETVWRAVQSRALEPTL